MTSNQKPSRKIPKNYSNITGKVSSQKANRLVGYESKLERDFIYLFEFDSSVDSILEQPVTIKFMHEGKRREYTPDFYLKTNNSQKDLLIEIKYKDDLRKKITQLKYKFKAAMEYARDNDLEFKILTNECPNISNKSYLFNMHFLLQYNYITFENYKLVKSVIKDSQTIQDILDKTGDDKYAQASFVGNIWALIRHNVISVNLTEKLTTNTKIVGYETLTKTTYEKIFGKIKKEGLFR